MITERHTYIQATYIKVPDVYARISPTHAHLHRHTLSLSLSLSLSHTLSLTHTDTHAHTHTHAHTQGHSCTHVCTHTSARFQRCFRVLFGITMKNLLLPSSPYLLVCLSVSLFLWPSSRSILAADKTATLMKMRPTWRIEVQCLHADFYFSAFKKYIYRNSS